jgi:hypothetical protein
MTEREKTLRQLDEWGVAYSFEEHPAVFTNDNTATVRLSFDALLGVIERNGNKIHFIEL